MDFVGTGRRLAAEDFARAAHMIDVDEAVIRAVVHVEARGSGWDNRNRPAILFEPHVFFRALPTRQLQSRAELLGLAYPSWRPGAYPASSDARYDQLIAARTIDGSAALKAASWGLGQVLGENHVAAGFASVEAMVSAMREGEGRQLDAMLGFVVTNRLDRHLRALNWAGFARGYNGPGYARNDYDEKLERAFRRFSGGLSAEFDPLADGMLALGDKGEAVKVLQSALGRHGYRVLVDGDFGPVTDQAVRYAQKRRRLVADGKVGPITGRALGLPFWN